MWDEFLGGTEEPVGLDSQKAASTIAREEMGQHCPDEVRQSILCPLSNQTDHEFLHFNHIFCDLSICLRVSELPGLFAW